ncbi:MAG: hypothetical protein ABIA76_03385 [Candidatus Diapherotrites archaeon]
MNRETAIKIPLNELSESEFHESTEEFTGNYVISKSRLRASRTNIWGIITSKELIHGNEAIELTDFTGKIKCLVPDEKSNLLDGIGLWESVQIIGKIRQKNELFILAESVKKLSFGEELLKRADNIYSLRNLKEYKKEKKDEEEIIIERRNIQ